MPNDNPEINLSPSEELAALQSKTSRIEDAQAHMPAILERLIGRFEAMQLPRPGKEVEYSPGHTPSYLAEIADPSSSVHPNFHNHHRVPPHPPANTYPHSPVFNAYHHNFNNLPHPFPAPSEAYHQFHTPTQPSHMPYPSFTPQGLHIKLPKLEIPCFSGEGVEGWLFQVERFFELHQIPPDQKLIIIPFYMTGEALKWYQWMFATRQIESWPKLARALQHRFVPSMYWSGR